MYNLQTPHDSRLSNFFNTHQQQDHEEVTNEHEMRFSHITSSLQWNLFLRKHKLR